MISRFCEECIKFRQKECEGKNQSQQIETFWGQEQIENLSGLNFCKDYEFDVRLYEFPDGSGKVETIKDAIKRGTKKRKAKEAEEAFGNFEIGASLSSADFENLFI